VIPQFSRSPPTAAEIDALANMQAATDDRVDKIQDDMQAMVKKTIHEALDSTKLLSEEERMWVRMAIKREAQSIKLRQAIIEKTLTGLLWMLILWVGVVFYEYIKAHGWKP
jgi:deoxyribose-phosphate aldolase